MFLEANQYSWLIVPIMLGGLLPVGLVMGLLIEVLPTGTDESWPTLAFVGGTILSVVGVTAIIMWIAIRWLGCCD